MKRIFIITIGLAILLYACKNNDNQHVKGNGIQSSKTFDEKGFTSIESDLNAELYLKQDSAFSVKVEGDENLIQHMEVRLEGSTLKIDKKHVDFDWDQNLKIYIAMPVINKLAVLSAASVKTENSFVQDAPIVVEIGEASHGTLAFKTPALTLKVAEASQLDISGETRDVTAEVGEASTLNAANLKAENVNIEASEASNAKVFASIQLTAKANEASGIEYLGNPKVNASNSVAGSVSKANE